ncbi:hypothetical protein O53_417 [Microcystis aeruginosa TAIHU98]|uniref:Uncharacterized protein n=1 Tax=Microcystis aeruginosa TAIHU98 TaxID=1134457 RepID=L7EAV9_MICAE|nr:hypothetical protein O53_417 [Microcystis aeruginosa TAIHU98]
MISYWGTAISYSGYGAEDFFWGQWLLADLRRCPESPGLWFWPTGNLRISCSPLHNPLGSWSSPSLDRLTIDRPFSGQNSKYKQIKYYYLLTN